MMPSGGVLPGYLLAVAALVYALLRARLPALPGDSRGQHIFLGTFVAVAVLWSIRAFGTTSLEIHVLGATAAALVLGAPRALLATAAAQALVAFRGEFLPDTAVVSWLFSGFLPVLVTDGIRRLTERYLPRHLFIYIFVICFAGAGVALGVSHILAGLVLGTPAQEAMPQGGLSLFVLMAFPEAFVNGMVMTMLVVYHPDWVETWDDRTLGGPGT